MTPAGTLRPALVCLLALSSGACGMVESDPHRFETMARGVAEIPLGDSGGSPTRMATRQTAEAGLRPPLKVEIMSPHELWDARDAGLRGAIEQTAPAMVEAAAPVIAEAVARRVSTRMAEAMPMRSAVASERTTIQLGAYSSVDAARAAWAKLRAGSARTALADLSPTFEMVQVDGKAFTRLKVSAPVETAGAICHAAAVTDPWCLRRG